MTDTQILTVILSTSMTLVVVIIGLFLNNRALDLVRNELRAEIKVVEAEVKVVESEVKVVDSKVDVLRDSFQGLRADIRLVMDKLDSLDTRLTRLEERRA